MSKFDIDEQNIYDMFSQIAVDSSKIADGVKIKLHEENVKIPIKNHRRWSKSAVAAIVMSVVLVATATATALGGFDWFIERFNPDFGKIVEPVENYSEDQGIRMEVIGAQKYGNKAIVYLSLQDMTGQNRITEQTDFRDGFSVKMNPREIGEDGETLSSMSWREKMIYFDKDTNKVYYEFNITADADSPMSNPLELGSFLIYLGKKSYEEPIDISLAEIKEGETTPIIEDNIWGGVGIRFDDYSSFTEVLTPGYYTDMPHGEKEQWVSNVGIIDGKLHVQIGRFSGGEFGPNDANLALADSKGNIISPDYELMLYGDKDNHLLGVKEDDAYNTEYKYNEYVFSVSKEYLNKYTLYYSGSVYTGVEGRWRVAANLSDSNKDIRTWTNDIPVEGHIFEYITLSPLGLQVRGTYEGENCMASSMKVEIETADGIIPLEGGGGSEDPEKHTFNSNWNVKEPLDVTKVSAIIIEGTRISIK